MAEAVRAVGGAETFGAERSTSSGPASVQARVRRGARDASAARSTSSSTTPEWERATTSAAGARPSRSTCTARCAAARRRSNRCGRAATARSSTSPRSRATTPAARRGRTAPARRRCCATPRASPFDEAPNGINVNAVCPGAVWTDMQQRSFARPGGGRSAPRRAHPYDAFVEYYRPLTPLARVQSREDVGKAVAFLASDDAAQHHRASACTSTAARSGRRARCGSRTSGSSATARRSPTPISNGRYTYATSDRCLVRVETDEGVTGLGLGDGGVGLAGAPRMIEAHGREPAPVARRRGSAGRRAPLGAHVGAEAARPPRLHDARDQHDRHRALGSARPGASACRSRRCWALRTSRCPPTSPAATTRRDGGCSSSRARWRATSSSARARSR